MSIQTNSEGLQRILQAVNDLPEGTQLPALSNPGTAADLASGKQLIDQNGNVITGTHQCPAGVIVKRYPASGLGTFTTDRNGAATVNCGFQPDVVYIQGERVYVSDAGQYLNYSAAIVFAEENRDGGPTTYIADSGGVDLMIWSKTSTGFAVEGVHMDYSWNASAAASKKYSYAAIKYTA